MSGVREVHIAGGGMQVRGRARQRCCWCGLTLLDKELLGTQHEERADGLPGEEFKLYDPGSLVAMVGSTRWVVPFNPETESLPPDCCTALDFDITA